MEEEDAARKTGKESVKWRKTRRALQHRSKRGDVHPAALRLQRVEARCEGEI